MIEIRDVDFWSNRQCNSCTSSENVREVVFKKEVSGTVVALCEGCRKNLLEQLVGLDEVQKEE